MAVEDAAALCKALSFVTSKSHLQQALRVVEKVRIPRTRKVQEKSLASGKVLHFCDGAEQEARDSMMRPSLQGKPLDQSLFGINDPATQLWAYGYNVVQHVERTWDETTGGVALPSQVNA